MAAKMESDDGSNKPSVDESHVGVPINVGISGIQQVIRCIQDGTTEVRDLIFNECELVYECRTCRNLFRSLTNFVYHKRQFCTKHFCESMVLFTAEDVPEEVTIVQPESPSNDNPDDGHLSQETETDDNESTTGQPDVLDVQVSLPKIYQPTLKLNKTTVLTEMTGDHNSTTNFYTKCIKDLETKSNLVPKKSIVTLRNIESNPNAVYQSIKRLDKDSDFDGSSHPSPVKETMNLGEIREKIEAARTVVIPQEIVEETNCKIGLETDSNSNSNISKLKERPDCDLTSLLCLKCQTHYMSVSSLEFHMRTAHSDIRLHYPCPICKASFAQLRGVVRHLTGVHKKTKEQASKLRDSIKKKAFRKNLDLYNSMLSREGTNNSSGEKGIALPNKKSNENVAIGGNLKSDDSKAVLFLCGKCNRSFARKSSQSTHERYCTYNEKSEKEKPIEDVKIKPQAAERSNRPKRNVKKKKENDFVDLSSVNSCRNYSKNQQQFGDVMQKSKLSAAALEKKALAIINVKKLQCLKCNRRFSTFSNLRRHAAIHIGWNRYKCKYCEYQSYNRTDCRNHIRRNHLQGRFATVHVDKLVVNLPPAPQPQTKKEKKSEDVQLSSSNTSKPTSSVSDGNFPQVIAITKKGSLSSSSSNGNLTVVVQDASPKKPRKSKEQCLYEGGGTISTLVTRSGSYPKNDLIGKYFQSKGQVSLLLNSGKKSDDKNEASSSINDQSPSKKRATLTSKFQKFIYVQDEFSTKSKTQTSKDTQS